MKSDVSHQSQYDPKTNVLHLRLPLTPSGNTILGWAWAKSAHLGVFKRDARSAVWAAVTMALGDLPKTTGSYWAEYATLSIIRCSRSRRRLDDDNVVIGCKYSRDALISSGVIIDDNPGRLRMVYPIEDRTVGHWGKMAGPGTHFFITRHDEMPETE